MELVPIKVKIGIRSDGNADYPNFNALPIVQNSGMDWSRYIDTLGSGWIYDSVGHKEVRLEGNGFDSPHGQQIGMILVPEDFADQAEAEFPGIVEKLNESKAEDFYNNCHAVSLPDQEIDKTVLEAIKLKQDLRQPLTEEQQKALDPNDPTRGIRKNYRKVWEDFKTTRGIEMPLNIRKIK